MQNSLKKSTLNEPEPPVYKLPETEFDFLASEHGLYDFGNLYSFTAWFKKETEAYHIDSTHPILLFGEPSDQQVFTIAACWLLGIPVFPVSTAVTETDLNWILDMITPTLAVTDSRNRERLSNTETLTIPDEKLSMNRIVSQNLFQPIDAGEIFAYILTSGSTSSPKIVPLKRRQVLFAAKASEQNFKADPNRYWLLCLPLNHVSGLSIILRSLLYHSAFYRMDHFDVEQVRIFLSENRLFQVASLVPTMMKRLLNDPGFRIHLDVKAILLGGGPITPSLIKSCIERGLPVVSSYGMTETFAQIAANPLLQPSAVYHPKKSTGRIFEPNQVEIRNEQWEKVSPNEPGTIWLKGPQVFDGYLNEDDNTDRFDSHGWFNTGDYGYMNRPGQLFIESRRSDLILSGGENINPNEVEDALERLYFIEQAAVIGIPDEEWGQIVVAFLVTENEDEKPGRDEIKSMLNHLLSPYKIPKKIIYKDQLPKTESGKVNKRKLFEELV